MASECSEAGREEATPAHAILSRGIALFVLVLPWLWAYSTGPSPNAWPLMVAWACIFVFMAILATGTVNRGDLPELVAKGWLVAAMLSSILALAQWFNALPTWSFVAASPTGRAYANLRQPNQFASLTSLGLLGLLWLASRGTAAWHWGAMALLAAGNAASASRTGFLQWLIIAALVAWWPTERTARLLVCMAALAAYALAAALLPMLLSFVSDAVPPSAFFRMGQDLGCNSRKVLWSNVLELIALRPLTGWGWGELDYAHYAHLYGGPRFCDILDNAHNLPLHLAVELGLPIAGTLMVAVAVWVIRQHPWAEASADRQIAWCAVVVIAVHSLLEYPLWYGPFQFALLASLVLLYRGNGLGLGARRVLMGIAVGGMLVLLFMQAQYDAISQSYLPASQRHPAFREDPVAAAGRVYVFEAQLRFAQLSSTPLTKETAREVHLLAGEMLHFSPEPRVIEKRIESAVILGEIDDAMWHGLRYRTAFPQDYERWRARLAPGPRARG